MVCSLTTPPYGPSATEETTREKTSVHTITHRWREEEQEGDDDVKEKEEREGNEEEAEEMQRNHEE